MADIHNLLIESGIDSENIKINEPMSKHTTFGIGGPADFFVRINTISQLENIIKISKNENIPLNIIRKRKQFTCKGPEELEG